MRSLLDNASKLYKNMYIKPLIEKLVAHNVVDLVMNGISMGPPLEVQQTFKDWDNKINVRRLPGYHLWNEVERAIDHLSPFSFWFIVVN